ncbi:YCF48-related protein [Roseateles sp. L2-2]|uniref:YCF48-related protein n=1 Tax=Roseateles sp. L2-2 TaxID=3422597 RepID=UPI003D36BC68
MSMNERMRAGWAGVLISAALLSACGGGGDDAPTPPPPPPPVQGVAIPDNLAIAASATTDVTSATAFTSNAAATTGLTFAWTFGDGSTSTDASPKHDFAKVGDYQVTLKVSNAAGASKEVKWTVTVLNRAHVLGLNCTAADNAGWCWQAPRPTGTTQNDLRFLDVNTGWSVGDAGEILRTVDGGQTWSKVASGVTTRLNSVRFADAKNGWIVGDFGALLRTTDGGAHWTLQPVGTAQSYSPKLQLAGANTLALVDGYRLRATADGGATWVEQSFQNEPQLASDGTVWVMEGLALRRSTDFGKTLVTALTLDATDRQPVVQTWGKTVQVRSYTETYVPATGTTYVQRFRLSTDGGLTWASFEGQGLPANFWPFSGSIQMLDGLVGALAYNGVLYRTQDGGRTWASLGFVPGGSNAGLYYSMLAEGNWLRQYYENGTGVTVYEVSADAGASWTRVKGLPEATYNYRLSRIGDQTWLATSGYNGATLLSSDGLQTWKRVAGPDPDAAAKTLTAFWFFEGKRGLALTYGGDLMETVNGGLDWTAKLTGLAPQASSTIASRFQFIDAKTGWLLAGDGRVYMTEDGGTKWLTPLMPSNRVVSAFHFTDAANGFAVTTSVSWVYPMTSTVMSTTDGGKTWTEQSKLDVGYNDIKFSGKNGVMVGDGGRVAVSADGGKTWTGRFTGTSSSLRQLAFSDASTLWVVGDGGLLMSSTDLGVSWQAAGIGLSGPALRGIRFLDAQRGWAVGDAGTILLTVDGGKTWRSQVSGTQRSLSQVQFLDARTGWISGASGTLLATGTGGQ